VEVLVKSALGKKYLQIEEETRFETRETIEMEVIILESEKTTKITVETTVDAPIEKVWDYWTDPRHIMHWNNASTNWHTPYAQNDLKVGGRFLSRMEAKDGSQGFDFEGIYDEVKLHEKIAYSLADNRKIEIEFLNLGNKTRIIEIFDAEKVYPVEYQKQGWQAILDNFQSYVEK